MVAVTLIAGIVTTVMWVVAFFPSLQSWNIILFKKAATLRSLCFFLWIQSATTGWCSCDTAPTVILKPHQVRWRDLNRNCALYMVWRLIPVKHFCWTRCPGFSHNFVRRWLGQIFVPYVDGFGSSLYIDLALPYKQTCSKNCSRRCSSSFDESKGMCFI